LLLAEFAYNNSIHNSMWMMPFWANYRHHPPMEFKLLKASFNMMSQWLADATGSGMEDSHWHLQENLLEAKVL
jgi:hypothetical protein